MRNSSEAKDDYLRALEHEIVAYRYFASAVPSDSMFVGGRPVAVGQFRFEKPAHAYSMRVELGWAFFTRMEASLEVFVQRLGISLSRGKGILEHLQEHEVKCDPSREEGLRVYREIRNTLHHGDGDTSLLNCGPKHLVIDKGHEPHLLEEQIELFYELFMWLGDALPQTVSP